MSQKPTTNNGQPLDNNNFEFVAFELKRLTDLLAGLPLDDFIKACHARQLAGVEPYQTVEVRVHAEKTVEYLIEVGKWVVDEDDESLA